MPIGATVKTNLRCWFKHLKQKHIFPSRNSKLLATSQRMDPPTTYRDRDMKNHWFSCVGSARIAHGCFSSLCSDILRTDLSLMRISPDFPRQNHFEAIGTAYMAHTAHTRYTADKTRNPRMLNMVSRTEARRTQHGTARHGTRTAQSNTTANLTKKRQHTRLQRENKNDGKETNRNNEEKGTSATRQDDTKTGTRQHGHGCGKRRRRRERGKKIV